MFDWHPIVNAITSLRNDVDQVRSAVYVLAASGGLVGLGLFVVANRIVELIETVKNLRR